MYLMYGPEIVARTLSKTNVQDKFGNSWPYHPRSDHHSKLSCWVVLFDLMTECALLRTHAEEAKVGFGINHEIVDFKQNREKYFDFVLCTPRTTGLKAPSIRFGDLAEEYAIDLNAEERRALKSLPDLLNTPVGSVHVAFEAKACMTEHLKARPRLYDELNSSHLTIHGAADVAIAAAFVMVNAADQFISPERNKKKLRRSKPIISTHSQPRVTERVIEKVHEIARRSAPGETGFDAIGIVVIDSRNDGSQVTIVNGEPAPLPGDIYHYESMIRRIAQTYEARFSRI